MTRPLDQRRVNQVKPKAPPDREETAAGLPAGYSTDEYKHRLRRLRELKDEGHHLGTWLDDWLNSLGYRHNYQPYMPPGTTTVPHA